MTDDLLVALGGLLGLLGMMLGGYTLWRMNRDAKKGTADAGPRGERRGKRSFVIFWVAIGGAILSSVVVFLLLR